VLTFYKKRKYQQDSIPHLLIQGNHSDKNFLVGKGQAKHFVNLGIPPILGKRNSGEMP